MIEEHRIIAQRTNKIESVYRLSNDDKEYFRTVPRKYIYAHGGSLKLVLGLNKGIFGFSVKNSGIVIKDK